MHTSRIALRRASLLGLMALGAMFTCPTQSRAQGCPPPGGICEAGTPQHIDFEAFAPGTPVEGLGAVHPDLAITTSPGLAQPCMPGTAAVIEELNMFPFASYGSTGGANDCLNGIRGMGDDAGCVLNYLFTFSPGSTVSCFSIRVLDFGDLLPFGGPTHSVRLRGFIGAMVADQDLLTVTSPTAVANGDACAAGAGDPGNTVLTVSAIGMTSVTLEFDSTPDPNVGFDDIEFCLSRTAVPAVPATWAFVKNHYRD